MKDIPKKPCIRGLSDSSYNARETIECFDGRLIAYEPACLLQLGLQLLMRFLSFIKSPQIRFILPLIVLAYTKRICHLLDSMKNLFYAHGNDNLQQFIGL